MPCAITPASRPGTPSTESLTLGARDAPGRLCARRVRLATRAVNCTHKDGTVHITCAAKLACFRSSLRAPGFCADITALVALSRSAHEDTSMRFISGLCALALLGCGSSSNDDDTTSGGVGGSNSDGAHVGASGGTA